MDGAAVCLCLGVGCLLLFLFILLHLEAIVCTSQLTPRIRNLIGFAASRDIRMKSYFIAEVVRCAFSYGCYQMEVFQGMFPSLVRCV